MNLFKNLFGMGSNEEVKDLIKANAKIIDVRSPGEFASGHVPGSKNIPLDKIETKLKELKDSKEALVLCCASGNRSGMAVKMLEKHGIKAFNGGGWNAVKQAKSN